MKLVVAAKREEQEVVVVNEDEVKQFYNDILFSNEMIENENM